jgi:hypothetical protein
MPEPKQAIKRKGCGGYRRTHQEIARAALRFARVPQEEGVSQVAARILAALVDFNANSRSGHRAILEYELEHARRLHSRTDQSSTFEMEQLEALTGAVESIAVESIAVESINDGRIRHSRGAVRLLEHLAQAGFESAPGN